MLHESCGCARVHISRLRTWSRVPVGRKRQRTDQLKERREYGAEGDGVVVSGVLEGRPAAKAGLKEGDRIVELAGKTVKNLEGYMALMAGHKGGDVFDIGILRDGKKLTLKVTLE